MFYILGLIRKKSLRASQNSVGSPGNIREHRPLHSGRQLVLYPTCLNVVASSTQHTGRRVRLATREGQVSVGRVKPTLGPKCVGEVTVRSDISLSTVTRVCECRLRERKNGSPGQNVRTQQGDDTDFPHMVSHRHHTKTLTSCHDDCQGGDSNQYSSANTWPPILHRSEVGPTFGGWGSWQSRAPIFDARCAWTVRTALRSKSSNHQIQGSVPCLEGEKLDESFRP
jgi:hypothetical protein